MSETILAPGWPGIAPRWTSSAKQGVGTALSAASSVWFTLSHGILNEVYYPRLDQACTRDLGLIVTDGAAYFSEEKRHAESVLTPYRPGIPAFRLTNTCRQGRYRIEKEILTDPARPVVLQWTRLTPLRGRLEDYHLYALLAPHLGNRGYENTAWVSDYKGIPMLFAERDGVTLALACSVPWSARTVGYVGVSDGWQDLVANQRLTRRYERAERGNVALTGEIDVAASQGACVLALGFGQNAAEAGHGVRASLLEGFDSARSRYLEEWERWQASLRPLLRGPRRKGDLAQTSIAVLRTHESKQFPGGVIASLSIPWGASKGDDDLGGYHLVWPRDLVEAAGGLLAVGAREDVRTILGYLHTTQQADGSWPQNMWIDGTPYWSGVQMDETALPILLVDLACREGALDEQALERVWPMVRRAAGFLVRNGPVTQQDRWEEDPGYSPSTLAAEIAALLAAAELADRDDERPLAGYLRETADARHASLDRWTYAVGTPLAAELGVEGYYVRIAPPDIAEAASPMQGFVPIKNRPPGLQAPAAAMISPDALALVRFGLRAPDDPRILNTVHVIDALLKTETPLGPVWHRYNGDGYGEHVDGSPFDGTGVGRGWPLLTGERAHYELAAGHRQAAERLRQTMAAFAGNTGLLPEQVWDAADVPDRELSLGRPSGSAMPLVWAHAEYLKLCRSLERGEVFDLPPQPVARYVREDCATPYAIWRFNQKCRTMSAGALLRIETLTPALVHWSTDGWQHATDTPTRDTGLGVHVADLATSSEVAGGQVVFPCYWPEAARWEGRDFTVEIESAPVCHRNVQARLFAHACLRIAGRVSTTSASVTRRRMPRRRPTRTPVSPV